MKRILMFGILCILAIGGSFSSASPAAEDIVLIGHNRIEGNFSQEDIQQIFLGKKTRWHDNTIITFVIFNQEDVYKSFLKEYVRKTYSQYLNYWKKQVFTGKGRMPKAFNTPEELMTFLATTEGAVSFARIQDIDPTRVKILSVLSE